MLIIFYLSCLPLFTSALHLTGVWDSDKDFFKFLARFGFQQTVFTDREHTQGYIYGNITSLDGRNFSENTYLNLVVVDSEYFLNFYTNATAFRAKYDPMLCTKMFKRIDTIAWDNTCNPSGKEDFRRRIPCSPGALCPDEDSPANLIKGYQFTYIIQDTEMARFWYISLVSCSQNNSCKWYNPHENSAFSHSIPRYLKYDIWLVNGHPGVKHLNPFEHQFGFDAFDTFEIHLVFTFLYLILIPAQLYAYFAQHHPIPLLLSLVICLHGLSTFCNLINVSKFAVDGQDIFFFTVVANILMSFSQNLFQLLLLLLAKGWTITRTHITARKCLYLIWLLVTIIYIVIELWSLSQIDALSSTDTWDTWPGLILLGIRMCFMVWFVWELQSTFLEEALTDKLRFYLHFGAGAMVWFVSLPITTVIATQVSALWRFKLVLAIMSTIDLLAVVILVHMFWPSRSKVIFNLLRTKSNYKLLDDEDKAFLVENDDSLDEEDVIELDMKRYTGSAGISPNTPLDHTQSQTTNVTSEDGKIFKFGHITTFQSDKTIDKNADNVSLNSSTLLKSGGVNSINGETSAYGSADEIMTDKLNTVIIDGALEEISLNSNHYPIHKSKNDDQMDSS